MPPTTAIHSSFPVSLLNPRVKAPRLTNAKSPYNQGHKDFCAPCRYATSAALIRYKRTGETIKRNIDKFERQRRHRRGESCS